MRKILKFMLFVLICLVGLFLFLCGLLALANSPTYQVFGEIIPRVETSGKVVALTFDDGPNEHTDELLQILTDKDVKTTFFVIGDQIDKFPMETKKIVEAGHELGNHSYSHQRMIFKSPSFIAQEIEKTDELIKTAGYQGEIHFRPPYGKKLIFLPWYLKQHHKKNITWDVEPLVILPAATSKEEITEFVLEQTKPGSIILIHPWYGEHNASREAIPGIIDGLKAQGYRFGTVDELFN